MSSPPGKKKKKKSIFQNSTFSKTTVLAAQDMLNRRALSKFRFLLYRVFIEISTISILFCLRIQQIIDNIHETESDQYPSVYNVSNAKHVQYPNTLCMRPNLHLLRVKLDTHTHIHTLGMIARRSPSFTSEPSPTSPFKLVVWISLFSAHTTYHVLCAHTNMRPYYTMR